MTLPLPPACAAVPSSGFPAAKVLPAKHLPPDQGFGGRPAGQRPAPSFRIADMYVGETTCDGKKRPWEILAEDVPTYVMQLPQTRQGKDIQDWAYEIRLFMERWEVTGNKVTPEKLGAAIKLINDKRRACPSL